MPAPLRLVRHRGAWLLGVIAAVVAAIAVVALRVQATHSPEHRARAYLAQLASGDFGAAFDGATVPRYALQAKADERISDARVVSTTVAGSRARATVSYRLAGRQYTATVSLERRGGGPLPSWVVTTPLKGELTVSVSQPPTVAARADYRVGGAQASGAFAPADGDSNEYRSGHLTLAPGRYTLTGQSLGGLMRAPSVSLLVTGSGGTGGVGVAWSLTPKATESARSLVTELLDAHCFRAAAPTPDCVLNPLAPATSAPSALRWASVTRPAIALNRDGTVTTTTAGRASSGSASVAYAVQGIFAVDEGGSAYLTNVTARAD